MLWQNKTSSCPLKKPVAVTSRFVQPFVSTTLLMQLFLARPEETTQPIPTEMNSVASHVTFSLLKIFVLSLLVCFALTLLLWTATVVELGGSLLHYFCFSKSVVSTV